MIADLRKRLAAKLRSKRGESIGETLVALLISSLALLMLAGAVSAAANVVTRSKEAMINYYAENDGDTIKAEWRTRIVNELPGDAE